MINVSETYLELFLENLRNLPIELHEQFIKIKVLDKKLSNTCKTIQQQQREYLNLISSKRSDKSKQIRNQIKQGKFDCDEKFRIINEIYDSVDNCIRRLDSDFSRFESELKGSIDSIPENESVTKIKSPKLIQKKKNKKNLNHSRNIPIKKSSLILLSKSTQNLKLIKSQKKYRKKIKLGSESHVGIPASASLVLTLTNNPNEVLEMPTDPYEPVYCDCHDVSYGDMIGCDNLDCPIEWFHFACVGIIEKPKGLWYCPRCRPKFSKS